MEIEDHVHYKSADLMWKIVSPILIIIGSVGNIITIIVLSKEKPRKTSTTLFLLALACSDLVVLNTGLLRQWINYAFGTDIRNDLSEFGCKCHWFIVYLMTQFSSWMLICVTVERVISTWMPHRRNVACTVKSAVVSIFVIACTLVLLNSHYFYGYGSLTTINGTETTVTKCSPLTEDYDWFIQYEWVWIDLCVFYLFPIFILLIGNCAIIYKVLSSQRKSRRTVVPAITKQVDTRQGKQISRLTLTLMVLSAVFFICITPIVVYPIGEPYWKRDASNEHLAFLFWWETFANLMMYINHSINCILYYLSGTKFRRAVQNLICRRRPDHNDTIHPGEHTNSYRNNS